MAKPAEPIAEKNPFLTGTAHAPATALSEKLGLSPISQYGSRAKQGEKALSEESERSDDLLESEHEVDESVLEEMAKLENTFEEIGLKFRMIDRIGEGMLIVSRWHEWLDSYIANDYK